MARRAAHHGHPLANHSDPTITGCRSPCNTTAESHRVAKLANVTCLKNHEEEQIRAMLDKGPVSVSIAAHWLNGYKGGIINCTSEGIDHAVLLVGKVVLAADPVHQEEKMLLDLLLDLLLYLW